MKKVFFLMLFSLFWVTVYMNAQVTIGNNEAPHPGAVLDLRTTKGLLLPKVNILNANVFQLSSDRENEAIGMIIYNTNDAMVDGQGQGLYIWNGSKWMLITSTIPVTSVTIDQTNPQSLDAGRMLFLTATVLPATATNKNVTWSIHSGSGATVNPSSGMLIGSTMGRVVVRATSQADNTKYDEIAIDIVTGEKQDQGYSVYCYPDHLGCWMIDNSKLGTPTQTTYDGQPPGARGYYYVWSNAAGACPSGYHLPSRAEWNALKSYLNSSNAAVIEKKGWFDASRLAGLYNLSQGAGIWEYWSDYGFWWSSGAANEHFSTGNYHMDGQHNIGSSLYLSVRCVMSN